jgi:hypothetical protein
MIQNFNFKRLLYSKFGKILISILLGLGLASLFRKACNDRKCLKFIGPDLNEIKEKSYKFDNKCYKFKPVAKSCSTEKKIINF